MECLVSIIIPIYNTAEHLKACIESVLSQTYKKIEVLLVDDGSTDESANICDACCLNDNRVRVFHKTNGGISSARNLGLKNATGQYVVFVDSDDVIQSDCIETLLANIGEADALACGYFTFKNQNAIIDKNLPACCTYMGHKEIQDAYLKRDLKKFFYNPWGKIYRTEKIETIFDDKLIVAEDIVFNLNFLKNSSMIKMIDYCGYGLRLRGDSTTHTIARNYSKLYEHDFRIIVEAIIEAKRDFGISENILKKQYIKDIPMRYYHEVTNLFRKNSPYRKKEILAKIDYIHKDREFISAIKENEYKHLSKAEKIAKLSSVIGNNLITYYLFKTLLKLRREI